MEYEETEALFSTELPLGKVQTIYGQAKLVNEAGVREQLNKASGNTTIECQFVPISRAEAIAEYLEWLPSTPEQ